MYALAYENLANTWSVDGSSMDSIDRILIRSLMRDGRASWADLARDVSLSPAATAERVHRLEARGVITGYYAAVDAEQVGQALLAFVAVSLERPQHRDAFLEWVNVHPEVQECHHLAGDDDYLLKVRCTSTRALERLVSDDLKALDGIARTRTMITLSSVKESPAFDLPPHDSTPVTSRLPSSTAAAATHGSRSNQSHGR